jgi:hypothetical protein
MTTPAPNCAYCRDTGSLSQRLEGDLDCGHCDAAIARARLNSWCAQKIPKGASKSAAAWLIYLHGLVEGIDAALGRE